MGKKPKITDIYFDRIVTRPERDESGQLIRVEYEIRQNRQVKSLPAGLRFVNFFTDIICYQILIYFLYQVPTFPYEGLILFLSTPFYFIFCEYSFQKTIGKVLTKSVVVNEYGEPIDLRQAILRTIIRYVPFEALSFLGRDDRGWHDT